MYKRKGRLVGDPRVVLVRGAGHEYELYNIVLHMYNISTAGVKPKKKKEQRTNDLRDLRTRRTRP